MAVGVVIKDKYTEAVQDIVRDAYTSRWKAIKAQEDTVDIL